MLFIRRYGWPFAGPPLETLWRTDDLMHLARVLLAALCLLTTAPAVASAEPDERVPGVAPATGLPIPRFVTLRSAEVNVRTGPGVRYPVEWVYVRKGIPVEITAEFDTWRRIRDWEGTDGWVHQSMLSGKRTVMVSGAVRSLRASPAATATVVATAQPGVFGRLKKCQGSWCEVELDGHDGWLPRSEFYGVYPDEAVDD